ncbi:MAG: hypothetical protein II530_00315 [Bacteroidaceae bacterium]|jgi:hypothetical protein|nr:hypothetical protein [Bacteroidaceae bacterium]
MFNPNGTFKWSVDLATVIYSNPEANTTWEYIYPQICKYIEDKGKTCTLEELGDRKIVSVDNLEITVMTVGDTIGISYRMFGPLSRQILDEAYDNKMIFGLPVSATMMMDDIFPVVTITFMSRETWESLNTPEAREFERRMNMIDRLWGVNSDDNDTLF